jgi:protein arginine kinase activator
MSIKKSCDKCKRRATYHSVEIVNGQKIEKHLCDHHAEQEGLANNKTSHAPINELLSNFVKLHSGSGSSQQELVCENCGLSWKQFKESSLLGCQNCYKAFEQMLSPLLERAHEGGTHHVGKVPVRAGANEVRQQQLIRMRHRLEEAVSDENYELAAKLRDEIRTIEEQS